jgi:TonB family protein
MTQDPRSRAHSPGMVSRRQEHEGPSQASPSGRAIRPGIKDILRTLAAHGAGTASIELAFDLVLHEIVEEAQETTHATGAAIAWMRDGEMVCRATTGENAPNLGVRVDMRSGLIGACVDTEQIQNCPDTDNDSRVNAEACRQLGVRSMLVAPISRAGETLGILQLYSSKENAFGENEIIAVRPFISRSIEAWMEVQAGDQGSSGAPPGSHLGDQNSSDGPLANIRETEDESPLTGYEASRTRIKDFSNSILLIAVLAVAIILGLALGWRWGRKQFAGTSGRGELQSAPIVVATVPEPSSQTALGSYTTTPDSSIRTSQGTSRASSGTAGGLVISEDGKVIYRSIEHPSNAAEASLPPLQETRLLRRVDPAYPPAAIAQHLQGPVVLDVKVMADGNVSDVLVRSGNPLLAGAAIQAVRQWRFQSSEDRSAVERQTQVTIRFTLPVNP